MARLAVDIQLEVLIVHQKTASLLEYRKVRLVTLRQQIHVIAMRQLRAHLHRLAANVRPADRMDVRPVALLAAFAQTRLQFRSDRLQIVMHDLEVGKFREFGVVRQHFDCSERIRFIIQCKTTTHKQKYSYPGIWVCATTAAIGRRYRCPTFDTRTRSCDSFSSRNRSNCRWHQSTDDRPRRPPICSPDLWPSQRPRSGTHDPENKHVRLGSSFLSMSMSTRTLTSVE